MLKMKSMLEVEIAGNTYQLYCNTDSPLGNLHDALMQMKGWAVDRMVKAQKEEQEAADAQIKEEPEEVKEESPSEE